MSVAGTADATIEIIGGLVCDIAPNELPPGVSPDCQDVIFSESSVRTRPGLTAVFAALNGNPTVNYLRTYIKLDGTLRLLAYSSLGDLWKESAQGVLSLVQTAAALQSAWPNSATLFGREFLAFGDGKTGQDIPKQFDDTNLDRVSQSGPGAAPTVADESTSASVTAISQPAAVAISAASAVGFLGTITTSAAHGLGAGDTVTISGVTPAGYNGNFTVQSVIDATHFTIIVGTSGLGPGTAFGTSASATASVTTGSAHGLTAGQLVILANVTVGGYNGTFTVLTVADATHFTYRAGTGGLTSSSGGTAGSAGSIAAGVHGLAVAFETRQGYITAPSPSVTWTAAGGRRAVISGIPVGPPNVTARILLFTAAGGESYYWIPQGASTLFSGATVISDNTTTTVTVDFTDAILLGATSGQQLFNRIVLGECAGVIDYSQRLFWWGERNKQNNWLNLDFDGGFVSGNTAGAVDNLPLGWTADPTFGPGKTDEETQVVWGCALAIVGNGATPTRGMITQSAVQDSFGVPRLQTGAQYSVRARISRNNTLAQGTLHIHLFSQSGGINTAGIQVTAAQATTGYVEYTAVLTNALASIPSDLVLRIYADGTPTNNGKFFIDDVEVFPTATPVNPSLLRVSNAEDQESYDGVTGFLNVAENNGQALRAAFKLRERLYLVKEHSLYVTQDDGATEPSSWTVSQVSQRVGTLSARGVAAGNDWAVIADRAGLFITNGGEPLKISQEVGHSASGLTKAWDQINWQYGHTIWVVVDTQERRILIGAPFGAATTPNAILQLDYRDITPDSAEAIADSPAVTISYRGRKIVRDKSRKWSPWTISANAAAIVERFDGTQQVFFGAGAYGNQAPGGNPTGKIYQLDAGNLKDDGLAIPAYYTTAFVPQPETRESLGLNAHRMVFRYLTMYCEGAGLLNVTAYPLNAAFPQLLPLLTLSSPAARDLEAQLNVAGERVAFKVASDATVPGNWFRLQKLTPSVTPDPWAPVRGQN